MRIGDDGIPDKPTIAMELAEALEYISTFIETLEEQGDVPKGTWNGKCRRITKAALASYDASNRRLEAGASPEGEVLPSGLGLNARQPGYR